MILIKIKNLHFIISQENLLVVNNVIIILYHKNKQLNNVLLVNIYNKIMVHLIKQIILIIV